MSLMFKKNTMRKVFLGSAIAVWSLFLAADAFIIIRAFKCGDPVEWVNIGIFIASILAGLAGLAYMKKEEKKIEIKQNEEPSN